VPSSRCTTDGRRLAESSSVGLPRARLARRPRAWAVTSVMPPTSRTARPARSPADVGRGSITKAQLPSLAPASDTRSPQWVVWGEATALLPGCALNSASRGPRGGARSRASRRRAPAPSACSRTARLVSLAPPEKLRWPGSCPRGASLVPRRKMRAESGAPLSAKQLLREELPRSGRLMTRDPATSRSCRARRRRARSRSRRTGVPPLLEVSPGAAPTSPCGIARDPGGASSRPRQVLCGPESPAATIERELLARSSP